MKYFVLDVHMYPLRRLAKIPSLPRGPWFRGEKITYPVKTPLKFALTRDPGELLPFYSASAPLFRDDVIKVIRKAGAGDHLQLFDAVLHDPKTKKDLKNYKAVNIIGMSPIIDVKRSKKMKLPHENIFGTFFEGMKFDEKKAGDLLLFRAAESHTTIVVHEQLKKALESAALKGLVFLDPKDAWG